MSTKETWSSRLRQDSDATYQEWRDEFRTKLALLTYLTADETNITPGAGARASANSEQGYAVYHLNDSLHGTAPVYIRFGFGSGSSNTVPRVQVTTGTATNGSGVLSGTALSTIATMCGGNTQTTDTARNSYFSNHPGFLGLSWKQGAVGDGLFIMQRSCDSTGAITATGSLVVWGSGSANSLTKTQGFRYASTAAAYTLKTTATDTMLGFNVQAQASTLVGSDIQVSLAWMITPQVAPMFGVCGVVDAEVSTGTSFSVTLVGTSARTYIALNTTAGPFGPGAAGSTQPKMAFLWE